MRMAAINLLVFKILTGADQENLNIRGAVLHVLGDLLGSVAAIIAALVIIKTGWTPIDPLLSVLVACLILRSAWFLVKDSAHILLEGAPSHIDRRAIRDDLPAHIEGLIEVKHIHAWSITPERPMLTLEAFTEDDFSLEDISFQIKTRLKNEFHIDHATVDVMLSGHIMDLISPNLKLPYLAPAQAQKHVTHNEALRQLDAIVQLSVNTIAGDAPAAPDEGERYIVAASADWYQLNSR